MKVNDFIIFKKINKYIQTERDGKLRYLTIFRGLSKIQEVIYLNSDD